MISDGIAERPVRDQYWYSGDVINSPSCVNISAISSLAICPSLSLSKIWKPSLNSLTCAACNFDSALLSSTALDPPSIGSFFDPELAPRVGDGSLSLCTGARPRGVQILVFVVGVEFAARGVEALMFLEGEGFGVDCLSGDGDKGLSGLRNGEALGEPYDRGEGLYEVVMMLAVRVLEERKSRWGQSSLGSNRCQMI